MSSRNGGSSSSGSGNKPTRRRRSDAGRDENDRRTTVKTYRYNDRKEDTGDRSLPQATMPSTGQASHIPDQFPGQVPMEYAIPYRPHLPTTDSYGEASSYYGDQGESVAYQPGVRPGTPLIVGAEPHLLPASAVANPAQDTGNGSAADFYNIGHFEGTAGSTMKAAASQHSSPPHYPPVPIQDRPGLDSARPPSQHGPSFVVPSAIGAAATHHQHYQHQSQHDSHNHYSTTGPYPASSNSHSQRPRPSRQSPPRRKGALRRFAEWWNDYDDVRKMEEYTEYIGVCRDCFDPNSQPVDSPRRHRYNRRVHRDHGHRVDKDQRYSGSSSESEPTQRRRSARHRHSPRLERRSSDRRSDVSYGVIEMDSRSDIQDQRAARGSSRFTKRDSSTRDEQRNYRKDDRYNETVRDSDRRNNASSFFSSLFSSSSGSTRQNQGYRDDDVEIDAKDRKMIKRKRATDNYKPSTSTAAEALVGLGAAAAAFAATGRNGSSHAAQHPEKLRRVRSSRRHSQSDQSWESASESSSSSSFDSALAFGDYEEEEESWNRRQSSPRNYKDSRHRQEDESERSSRRHEGSREIQNHQDEGGSRHSQNRHTQDRDNSSAGRAQALQNLDPRPMSPSPVRGAVDRRQDVPFYHPQPVSPPKVLARFEAESKRLPSGSGEGYRPPLHHTHSAPAEYGISSQSIGKSDEYHSAVNPRVFRTEVPATSRAEIPPGDARPHVRERKPSVRFAGVEPEEEEQSTAQLHSRRSSEDAHPPFPEVDGHKTRSSRIASVRELQAQQNDPHSEEHRNYSEPILDDDLDNPNFFKEAKAPPQIEPEHFHIRTISADEHRSSDEPILDDDLHDPDYFKKKRRQENKDQNQAMRDMFADFEDRYTPEHASQSQAEVFRPSELDSGITALDHRVDAVISEDSENSDINGRSRSGSIVPKLRVIPATPPPDAAQQKKQESREYRPSPLSGSLVQKSSAPRDVDNSAEDVDSGDHASSAQSRAETANHEASVPDHSKHELESDANYQSPYAESVADHESAIAYENSEIVGQKNVNSIDSKMQDAFDEDVEWNTPGGFVDEQDPETEGKAYPDSKLDDEHPRPATSMHLRDLENVQPEAPGEPEEDWSMSKVDHQSNTEAVSPSSIPLPSSPFAELHPRIKDMSPPTSAVGIKEPQQAESKLKSPLSPSLVEKWSPFEHAPASPTEQLNSTRSRDDPRRRSANLAFQHYSHAIPELIPLPPSRPGSPYNAPVHSDMQSPSMSASSSSFSQAYPSTPSSTAIPLRFLRHAQSPSLSRSSPATAVAISSPVSSPPANDTPPRTKGTRPASGEFKIHHEFRPLYLVERNTKPSQYNEEENFDSLPSLPSSTSGSTFGSRTPSVSDDREEDDGFVSAAQSPAGLFVDERKPAEEDFAHEGYFDLPEDDHQHDDIEFLDSQQVTPKASALGFADGERDLPELDLGGDVTMVHHPQAYLDVMEEDSILSPQEDLPFVTPFESNAFMNRSDDGDEVSTAQSPGETKKQKTSSFFPIALSGAVATAAAAISGTAFSSDVNPSAAAATEPKNAQLIEHDEVDSSIAPQAIDLPDIDESWTQYNRPMSKKDKEKARKQEAQMDVSDTTDTKEPLQPAIDTMDTESNTTPGPKSEVAQEAASVDDSDKRSDIGDLQSEQPAHDDEWAQQARPMSKKVRKKATKQTNRTVEREQNEPSSLEEAVDVSAAEEIEQPELVVSSVTVDSSQQEPAGDIWPEIQRPLSKKDKKKAKKLANRSLLPEGIEAPETEPAVIEAPQASSANTIEDDQSPLDSNWSLPSKSKKDRRTSKKSGFMPNDQTDIMDDATPAHVISDMLALTPVSHLAVIDEDQASITTPTETPAEVEEVQWHGSKLSRKDKKKAKREAKQADRNVLFSTTSELVAGDGEVPHHSSVTTKDVQPENIALPEDDDRAILEQLQPAEVPLPGSPDDELREGLQPENIALPDDSSEEMVELLEPAEVPLPGFEDDDLEGNLLQPIEVPLPESKDDDLEENSLQPAEVPLPASNDDDLEEYLPQPTEVPLPGSEDDDLAEKLRPENIASPDDDDQEILEQLQPAEVPLPGSEDDDLEEELRPKEVAVPSITVVELGDEVQPENVLPQGYDDDLQQRKQVEEVPLPRSNDDDHERREQPEEVPLPYSNDDDLREEPPFDTLPTIHDLHDVDFNAGNKKRSGELQPQDVPIPCTSSEDLTERLSPEEVSLPYSDDEYILHDNLLHDNLPEEVFLAKPDLNNTFDTIRSTKTTEKHADPKVVALPEPDDIEAMMLTDVEDVLGQTGGTLARIQNATEDTDEASLGYTGTIANKNSYFQSSSSQPLHIETTVPSVAGQSAPEINLDPACLPLPEADEQEVSYLEDVSVDPASLPLPEANEQELKYFEDASVDPAFLPLPEADQEEVKDPDNISPVLLPLPKADEKEVQDLENIPPVVLPLPKAEEKEVKDLEDVSYMDNNALDTLHATTTKPSATLPTEANEDEWAFPTKTKKGKKGKENRAVSEAAVAGGTSDDLATKPVTSSNTQEIAADDITAHRMDLLEREIPPPCEVLTRQSSVPEESWSGSFTTKKKKDKKGKKGRKSYVEEERSREEQLPKVDVPALTDIDGLETTEDAHAVPDLEDTESVSASEAKNINDTDFANQVQAETARELPSSGNAELGAATSDTAVEDDLAQDLVLPDQSEAPDVQPEDEWAYPIKTKKDKKSKKGKTAAIMPEQSETPSSSAEMATAPETPIEVEEEWVTTSKKSKKGKKAKMAAPLYDEPKASPATVEIPSVPQSPALQAALTNNDNLEDEWATTSKKGKKGKKNRMSSAAFDISEPQGSSSRQVEEQPENLPNESASSSTPVKEPEDAWATTTKKGKKGKKAKSRGTPFSWDPEPEVKDGDEEAESLVAPDLDSGETASNQNSIDTQGLNNARNEDVATSQATVAETLTLATDGSDIDPALVPLPESASERLETDDRVLPENAQETELDMLPLPDSFADELVQRSAGSIEEVQDIEAALIPLPNPIPAEVDVETQESDAAMLDVERCPVPVHETDSDEYAHQYRDDPSKPSANDEHETDKHNEQIAPHDGIVRKFVNFLTPAVLLPPHEDATSTNQTEELGLKDAPVAVPEVSSSHEQQNDLAHTKPIAGLSDFAGAPLSETQIGDAYERADDADVQRDISTKHDADVQHDRPQASWNESYVDRWAHVADVIAAQGDEDRLQVEDDVTHDHSKSPEDNTVHRQPEEATEPSELEKSKPVSGQKALADSTAVAAEENHRLAFQEAAGSAYVTPAEVAERDKTFVKDDDYSTRPISKKKKKKSKPVEREVYWWSVSEPAEKETEDHAPVIVAEDTSLNPTAIDKPLEVTDNDDMAGDVDQAPHEGPIATPFEQAEVPVSKPTAQADDRALPSSSKKKRKGKKGKYQALDVFAEAFEQAVHPAEEAVTEPADRSGSVASAAEKLSWSDDKNELDAGDKAETGLHDKDVTVEITKLPERPAIMKVEEPTQHAEEDVPGSVAGVVASPPLVPPGDENTIAQSEDGKVEAEWPDFVVRNKKSKKNRGIVASTEDDTTASTPTFDSLVTTTLVGEGFDPSLVAEKDDNDQPPARKPHDALESDEVEASRRVSSVSRRRRSRENSQDRRARSEETSSISKSTQERPEDLPEASFDDIISSQLAAAGFDQKQLEASEAIANSEGVKEFDVRSSSPTSPSQLWQTSSRPASPKYVQNDPEESTFSTKPNKKKKKSRKDEVTALEPSQHFTIESQSTNLQDQEQVSGEIPQVSAATEEPAPQEKRAQQDSVDERASQSLRFGASKEQWTFDITNSARLSIEPAEALRSPQLDTVFEEDTHKSHDNKRGISYTASETARRIFSSSDAPRDSFVASMRAPTTNAPQPILITKQRMTSSPSTSEIANTPRQYSHSAISPLPSPGYTQARYSPTASITYNRSRSITPSLRRTDRKLSGDLRVLSQQGEGSNVGTTTSTTSQNKRETSDYDPLRGSGNSRMSDVSQQHEEWRDTRTSPRAPPSLYRKQSKHILDLESKLAYLTAENETLSRGNNNIGEMSDIQSRDHVLQAKDVEISQIKAKLSVLQQEAARLREHNDQLRVANRNLSEDTNGRYGTLQAENAELNEQYQRTVSELTALRQTHDRLNSTLEDTIANQITSALVDKDLEIQSLRAELDRTTSQITSLQRQLLASQHNEDYLEHRDEDYFDGACQELCKHIQQWILRFSKFSDNRPCRLTDDVHDERIEGRLDNAMLDGTDVDVYLADRVKRRDVFMSVVMTMIWEYIFTRYLFGLEREQRQKLKALERTLSEVGPARAVASWRATTLTLLSRLRSFSQQREQDTEAVVQEILNTLSALLPPPDHLMEQLTDSLRRIIRLAVGLSIEMRIQKPEYIMLPPLHPEYDENGNVVRKVHFNASLMNERSGAKHEDTNEAISNEEYEARDSTVRLVLFPLVVKKGDELGEGEEEIVVCPAQVLVSKAVLDRPRKVVRLASQGFVMEGRSNISGGGSVDNEGMDMSEMALDR